MTAFEDALKEKFKQLIDESKDAKIKFDLLDMRHLIHMATTDEDLKLLVSVIKK